MKKNLFIALVLFSTCAYSQKPIEADTTDYVSISTSLEAITEEAECWTPEQKKEFADVFFIEQGKFTIPKDPIILIFSTSVK
jgi:hypothetical protein